MSAANTWQSSLENSLAQVQADEASVSPVNTSPVNSESSDTTNPAPTTGATGGAVLNALGIPNWLGASSGISLLSSAWSAGRVVAIVLGLILILGGIFLFRPVQEAAVTATKTAAAS